MNKSVLIRLKAIFLLTIFSLNMVMGFACAIGVDMGFNKNHHEEDHSEIINPTSHKHHHHDEAEEHQQDSSNKNDDCCNNKVIKILQVDKALPQFTQIVSSVYFTAFIAVYYNSPFYLTSQDNTLKKYFVHGHHPPIGDIRVAICSFLI